MRVCVCVCPCVHVSECVNALGLEVISEGIHTKALEYDLHRHEIQAPLSLPMLPSMLACNSGELSCSHNDRNGELLSAGMGCYRELKIPGQKPGADPGSLGISLLQISVRIRTF